MNDSNASPIDVNQAHADSLSFSERIASRITTWVGTMACALIFTVMACISLPTVIAEHNALVWVTWITQTFLQLVLLPVIMVGQNLQNKHSEMRADETYKTSLNVLLLTEKIEKLLEQNEQKNEIK